MRPIIGYEEIRLHALAFKIGAILEAEAFFSDPKARTVVKIVLEDGFGVTLRRNTNHRRTIVLESASQHLCI